MRLTIIYMLVFASMGRAALGPELVRNGNFFIDAEWQKGSGWTITNGEAVYNRTGTSGTLIQVISGIEAGSQYQVTYTIAAINTVGVGYLTYLLGDTEGEIQLLAGTYTETVTASGSGLIEFMPVMSIGSTCRIDNVSVRKVVESSLGGDFDSDGIVDVNDLTLFAADWLKSGEDIVTAACDTDSSGTVDMADFAALSSDWQLNSGNTAPAVSDQAVSVVIGQAVQIALAATDQDYLSYLITQAPTKGGLTYLGSGIYRYRPWLESEGVDTFQWQCSDGQAVSGTATVTITILPEVLDNLRYDGRAVIEIEDGSNINLDPNCVITCWFRTLWSAGTLLSKRDAAGGPGLVVTIEDGYPVVTLAEQDGREHIYRLNYERVDDGQWWFLGIHLNDAVEENISITCEGPVNSNKYAGAVEDTILGFDPNNTAPLVVGSYLNGMFYGSVDYLTNSAVAGDTLTMSGALIEGRAGEVNMFSPNYYRRWLMDEGDGDTITDTVGGVTGTLSNHNRINWSTPDAALDSRGRQRSRLRGVDGSMMLPDYRKHK